MKTKWINVSKIALATIVLSLFALSCAEDDLTQGRPDHAGIPDHVNVPDHVDLPDAAGGNTISDIDGNVYPIVKIGEQWWMAANLKITRYNDGEEMDYNPSAGETGTYAWYADDYENYGSVYGALYNMTAIESAKLCPIGWHVSTDDDWKQLEIAIGMSPEEADLGGWRGEVGNLLKSTNGWLNDGNGTDNFGFCALPGGSGGFKGYFNAGKKGVWWNSEDIKIIRELDSEYIGIYRGYTKLGSYMLNSVRCVKD
jgi:uncharacterized protein (TIGR02145 family)